MTSVLKKPWGHKSKTVAYQEVAPTLSAQDCDKLLEYIDENVVGKETSFCGPFGRRKVVYCDYNGSGRALHFLEEHVARDVLPTHATQCTAMSHTSLQSCLYRSEARSYVLSFVGGCEEDVVILGASPARFLRALRPARPTVFVSARVPERQLAPWRECDAEIVEIPETKEGFLDLTTLEHKLQLKSGSGRKMIGFFPAASKLTGILTDDVATTCLLHQYGAWAFWDYSLVAPSAAVDMNSAISSPNFVEVQTVKKDAVFFNCEKFVGGVQAPFVAVVKKEVFKDTPFYMDDLVALAERIEEIGAVEAARATLVLQLRDAVGMQTLAQRQDRITRQVLQHIKNIPELILLGSESPNGRRLPIFSLLVKHPRGTFLHHNFVCAVLNDVFGIQARGGLSDTFNYGQDVLGIDAQLLREYEKLLHDDIKKTGAKKPTDTKPNEHLRPGFCRISLPFFMSDDELGFVLEALKMVATEGWKILPQYVVNPENGQWRHHTNTMFRDRKSLFSIRYHDGKMSSHERRISGPGIFPQNYTECLKTARNLFNRARKLAMKCSIADQDNSFNPRMDFLRWFMLPKEAHDLLLGRSANVKHIVPFDPSGYTGARKVLFNRGSHLSSPILGASPRHYSLSAIDDCALIRLKNKTKFFSRESSLLEKDNETYTYNKSPPVQFVVGESTSPVHLRSSLPLSKNNALTIRSRCYSLGSDIPSPTLSPQTKINLGLEDISATEKKSSFCNCGSQTDLQSLDDPMVSPTRMFPYSTHSSASISDCSQVGRTSPTTSIASHTSEDLHAYVKEMTKEIATEIKSEIREVISQVDDILENSDSVEASNVSMNSSQYENNSVSVTDVAQYLMGMSREMASEVKHEIREMVNQVDEMISPDMLSGSYMSTSRRTPPPQAVRRRIGSGPDLGLELKTASGSLKKCPTSPILSSQTCIDEDENVCYMRSPVKTSPKSAQGTPLHETSGPNNLSFNSSETSTPDTIIQVVSTSFESPTIPKSLSSHKFSDEDMYCADSLSRQYCNKKMWCQNPSVSSQDSGINMSFPETESYQDFVKWRTCSDPTHKGKRMQGKLKCQRYEKSEVPDIIEGVPVCSGDYSRQYGPCCGGNTTDIERVDFQISDNTDARENRLSQCEMGKERCVRSVIPTESLEHSDVTLGEEQRSTQEVPPSFDELRKVADFYQREEESSSEEEEDGEGGEEGLRRVSESTDSSVTDFTTDDDGKWHPPTKSIWKATVEAIREYGMIRHQDKVLVCLSGGRESLALLHTVHQYQFYARAKGIHFTIGAIFVDGAKSDIDPLHLMAYCRTLGVKFIYQDKTDHVDKHRARYASEEAYRWATHEVRRRVYAAAAAHEYTVLCLAQHLDHAARAFLASVFHGGALRTTRAHYYIREHNLRVIRPFIYVRESDIREFSASRQLPDFHSEKVEGATEPEQAQGDDEQCEQHVSKESLLRDRSISAPCERSPPRAQERGRTRSEPVNVARDILLYHEQLYPCLFTSLKNALHPLISAKNIDKDLKEHRHRKKSVIQMKNGAPVYDSEEGTDEDPVP